MVYLAGVTAAKTYHHHPHRPGVLRRPPPRYRDHRGHPSSGPPQAEGGADRYCGRRLTPPTTLRTTRVGGKRAAMTQYWNSDSGYSRTFGEHSHESEGAHTQKLLVGREKWGVQRGLAPLPGD